MRYIADANGYLKEISFGASIVCGGNSCVEYNGTVPSGYDSLDAWYVSQCGNLCQWKIVDGNLTNDSSVSPETDRFPVDFVIERGSSGIWKYERWNSGKCECWGRYTGTVNVTKSYSNVYYTDAINVEYPTSFYETPTLIVSGGSSSVVNWAREFAVNQYNARFIIVANASQSNASVTVDLHAIGKWK